jgi:hypothetical protein
MVAPTNRTRACMPSWGGRKQPLSNVGARGRDFAGFRAIPHYRITSEVLELSPCFPGYAPGHGAFGAAAWTATRPWYSSAVTREQHEPRPRRWRPRTREQVQFLPAPLTMELNPHRSPVEE